MIDARILRKEKTFPKKRASNVRVRQLKLNVCEIRNENI